MTKREYYDLLLRSCDDGTFPTYNNGGCYYRAPGGKKCAVGVLIPDEIAAVANGATVFNLDKELRAVGTPFDFDGLVEGLKIDDLRSVQNAHDLSAIESRRYGLNFKKVFVERLHKLLLFKEYASCTS